MEKLWDLQIIHAVTVKFQFDGQSPDVVILSERSESKDLCTNFIANEEQTRRFFDSVLRTPLRMTC